MVHSHVSRTSETKAVEIAFGNRIACCAGRSAAPVACRMNSQVKMQPSSLCAFAPNEGAPLNQNAKAIFTTVAHQFPSWLSADYFPNSVCNTAKAVAAASLVVGLGAPETAPVTAPAGTVAAVVLLVGCPW